ncbi:ammonia monooxygenase [Rahnella sikkimica]|uniref:Uncharacterized protein n=1 Tax=Rahnella sikkimica TaxID=1805933 RepID=A0A2L1UYU9_9GAMM|nr:ammonia monooxygenase [Rahnella sikkimica]AVF38067.1 hypothetical protein BV494_24520 [Rahnella sikkimica]
MHTHNVNIKTAARKTPERYSQVKFLAVIAEQQSFLMRLVNLWNLQLPQEEQEEEVSMLLMQLAENVLLHGVLDWSPKKPLISWDIACFWIQGQKFALSLYEQGGARAVDYARKDLADSLAHEKYYRNREREDLHA